MCFNYFHLCTTSGTGDKGSFFLSVGKHAERIDSQYDLKKFNEFLAAVVKESITPDSAKTFRQDMAHEQIKKLFSSHGPGPELPGLGVPVAKGHHAVFASRNVLLPDDTPVEIPAKIDDGFVAVTDVFAISDPLFGAIFG